MELRDLIRALRERQTLTARQLVQDAIRECVDWRRVPRPEHLDRRDQVIAAAIVEMLARRAGVAPPPWAAKEGGLEEPLLLDPSLSKYPRSLERAKVEGPEPLRRRNLIAFADFLEVR